MAQTTAWDLKRIRYFLLLLFSILITVDLINSHSNQRFNTNRNTMTQRRDTRIGSFTNLFQAWPSFQDLLANEEYYPPTPRNNTLSRSTTCPNRGDLLEAFPRKYHLNSSVSSSKDLNLNVEDWKRVSSAKKDKEVTFAEYLSLYVFQTCHPKAYSRADVDKFKRDAELEGRRITEIISSYPRASEAIKEMLETKKICHFRNSWHWTPTAESRFYQYLQWTTTACRSTVTQAERLHSLTNLLRFLVPMEGKQRSEHWYSRPCSQGSPGRHN